jgi:3-hydroxyisobutyrate dehydrogenase-like beta-hydroxyacid dehydrogenase
MDKMLKIAILGLGEAGSHFANDLIDLGVEIIGFDPNPVRKINEKVILAKSNTEAVKNADVIFSANLSSVSEDIAREIVPFLNDKQFFCEMNTSSPEKKKAIDIILKPLGVKMIDLAIMAPVPPKGIFTPFLAAGENSVAFLELMKPLNLNLTLVENSKIGDAATMKLLRSIVYKGVAAVICEAVEAGDAFGMPDYIRQQISSIIGGNDDLIDRFVEGSKIHALRRMHEMEAVIEMLEEKGLDPMVTRGTINNLEKMLKSDVNK